MRRNQFTYSSRDLMQLLVFSLVVVLGPLLFYPHTLGLEFSIGLMTLLMVETIYYLIVFSVVNSGAGLMASLVGSFVALSYRISLAALFGLMVFAPGSESWNSAFQQGLSGYWPAFGLFVLSSPFVTMSLVKWLIDRLDSQDSNAALSRRNSRQREGLPISSPRVESQVPSAQRSASGSSKPVDLATQVIAPVSAYDVDGPSQRESVDSTEFAFGSDNERAEHDRSNGFERGVKYLAEHAAVRVATIVDRDGYQLAGFARMGFSSDAWAPMALTIIQDNAVTLSRLSGSEPGRVELDYDKLRIDCRRVGNFYLLVVSDRLSDDLLSVRVSQTSEMINKYVSVRFSDRVVHALNSLEANMEESDVRSA